MKRSLPAVLLTSAIIACAAAVPAAAEALPPESAAEAVITDSDTYVLTDE